MQICLIRGPPKSERDFSFRGASPPDPPPGALPLEPAGSSAPRPPYRLALHALAVGPGFSPLPQLKIPGAATERTITKLGRGAKKNLIVKI